MGRHRHHRHQRRHLRPTSFRLTKNLALLFLASLLLSYALLLIPWLPRTLALETLITSRHQSLAKYLLASNEFINEMYVDSSGNLRLKVTNPDVRLMAQKDTVYVRKIRGLTYDGWVAFISNPKLVKVVLSHRLGAYGQKIANLASENNALLAINAGGFMDPRGEGTGGQVTGTTVYGGKYLLGPGYQNHNMVMTGLTGQGKLLAGVFTPQQAARLGLVQATSFNGPILVANGKSQISYGDGGWGYGPRTAIGQTRNGTLIWMVIDGRRPPIIGASMREVADLMVHFGAVTAVAQDGGASSVMWCRGRLLNTPSSPFGDRLLPDAWVVPNTGQVKLLLNRH